ncbi:MAG: hypothetical protein SEPTF4163_006698, partial [Sporothrix epigloea]
MSITNGSKGNATAGRHETPYDFPEWINFTKGMTSAVSALSDRDFGTELCGMISEDENFSPEDPPERLTNYVVAKTIAIVKGEGIRCDTLRELFSFILWTEETWQKVDSTAVLVFHRALAQENVGNWQLVGKSRGATMVTICQRAVEELGNVFASPHTHVTTSVVPALRLHQEELLTEPVDTTEIDAPRVPDVDEVQDKPVVDAPPSVESSTETPEASNSSPLFVDSPPSKSSPS